MQVYQDLHPLSRLKRFFLYKDKGLFVYLTGINIEQDPRGNIHIYPVYRPLLAWQTMGGQFVLEFSVGKKSLVLSLSARGIEIGLQIPEFPVSE